MKNILLHQRRKFLIIVAFLLSIIIFFTYRNLSKEIVYYPELSKEQKIEDFHKFYNIAIETMPFLEEVKAFYGIDFVKRKVYYENVISQTDNNAEFYAAMQAISRDLCSFHTDVCYPLYSNIQAINCYNSKKTANLNGMEETQNLWFECIGKEIKESNIEELVYVVYFDGEYIAINSEMKSIEEGDRLVSVNGISANDFLVQNLSLGKICYDGKRKSAYRTQFTFNGTSGDVVQAIWVNKKGEEYSIELYHSLIGELTLGYGYLYEQEANVFYEELPTIYSYRDNTNKVEYVKISDFSNNQGCKLENIFSDMEYKTIIIDLRGNYGGKMTYFNDYIYPYLYSENKSNVQYWKTNISKHNKKMTNNVTVRLNKFFETEENIVYRMSNLFMGKYAGDSKNIYYLIDEGTASSADFAAMSVKKHNLGILVGENTQGEGGGQSYICDKLNNSGLVFIYYSAVPCDEAGENFYTPGTEPDVYISATYEDYLEKIKDSNTKYENLVRYDPLIKWIIEND